MTSLNQIQQDIQTLSPAALDKLHQFIQLLRKDEPTSPEASSNSTEDNNADPDDWSDFIGGISAEKDLSVNYKAYLAKGWSDKYRHR